MQNSKTMEPSQGMKSVCNGKLEAAQSALQRASNAVKHANEALERRKLLVEKSGRRQEK